MRPLSPQNKDNYDVLENLFTALLRRERKANGTDLGISK